GMIEDMLERSAGEAPPPPEVEALDRGDAAGLARFITALETGRIDERRRRQLEKRAQVRGTKTPVLGITGTGGAGKSSLTDELILRFRRDSGDGLSLAVIAIDPSRRKTGGALLGDRIRMNAIYHEGIY